MDSSQINNFDDFNGGILRCDEECEFDTGLCEVCDLDGVAEDGEACDGSDLKSMSCLDFGFTSGMLRCTDQCEFDTSGCEVLVCDDDGNRDLADAEFGLQVDSTHAGHADVENETTWISRLVAGEKLACTRAGLHC